MKNVLLNKGTYLSASIGKVALFCQRCDILGWSVGAGVGVSGPGGGRTNRFASQAPGARATELRSSPKRAVLAISARPAFFAFKFYPTFTPAYWPTEDGLVYFDNRVARQAGRQPASLWLPALGPACSAHGSPIDGGISQTTPHPTARENSSMICWQDWGPLLLYRK